MNDWFSLLMVGGLALAVVAGLVVRYFIFRASCALVDVDPSPFKSILAVLFALAISLAVGVPLLGVPLGLFGKSPFDVELSSSVIIVWSLLGLAIIWAILGLLYVPILPVPFAKGFLLSAYEIVLGVLANALLGGVVLVVYAVYQIGTNSGPNPSHSALPAPPPALTTTQAS
jgi:hypothetical protein